MSQANESTSTKIHEKYVQRVRARLGRPSISAEEARDGILDCYVSSYFEGLKVGLKGLLGIKAEPEEVARVAAGMFRRRLSNHGVSFDKPTIEALSTVKEEVDKELHLTSLPAELKATHDQVCTLLLAKAEGSLEHKGNHSVVRNQNNTPSGANNNHANTPTSSRPIAAVSKAGIDNPVVDSLRAAFSAYLEECKQFVSKGDSVSSLKQRLNRAQKLLDAIEEFEGD